MTKRGKIRMKESDVNTRIEKKHTNILSKNPGKKT